MDTKSIKPGDRRNATTIVSKFLYASPLFCLIMCVLHKMLFHKAEDMIMINPTWHTQGSYLSAVVANANSHANSPSKEQEHSQAFFRQKASISNKQLNEVSGVDNFRKILSMSEIIETSSKLIAGPTIIKYFETF